MDIYFDLGKKLAAAGRRSVSTKMNTPAGKLKAQKALQQTMGNQQDPWRYGIPLRRRPSERIATSTTEESSSQEEASQS